MEITETFKTFNTFNLMLIMGKECTSLRLAEYKVGLVHIPYVYYVQFLMFVSLFVGFAITLRCSTTIYSSHIIYM